MSQRAGDVCTVPPDDFETSQKQGKRRWCIASMIVLPRFVEAIETRFSPLTHEIWNYRGVFSRTLARWATNRPSFRPVTLSGNCSRPSGRSQRISAVWPVELPRRT